MLTPCEIWYKAHKQCRCLFCWIWSFLTGTALIYVIYFGVLLAMTFHLIDWGCGKMDRSINGWWMDDLKGRQRMILLKQTAWITDNSAWPYQRQNTIKIQMHCQWWLERYFTNKWNYENITISLVVLHKQRRGAIIFCWQKYALRHTFRFYYDVENFTSFN